MARDRSPSGRLYAEHWDRIAPNWGDEVFNTLLSARSRVVAAELRSAARAASNIADFGCGVGTYLPLLSRIFDQVHGFEQSRQCVRMARERMRTRGNVNVDVAHRATPETRNRFEAVLSVNVALHPSRREWHQVLRSMFVMLKPGGRFLLVVPSLESADLATEAQQQDDDQDLEPPPSLLVRARNRPGIVRFGGVPTKHFAQCELRGALAKLGLLNIRFRRVEYSWASYGITPPPELRNSRPWDWLVVARKPAAP
jgi:SAM-dependent methyltransferase